MGAQSFEVTSELADPNEAFADCRDSAAWEYGHGGYTGTIAEKHEGFVIVDVPEGVAPEDYAQRIAQLWPIPDDDSPLSEAARIYGEKWGPAVALKTDDGWLFIGLASS